VNARSLGEVLAGREAAKARRTFQPVRRNSYHAGEREARLWRPIAKDEIGPRLRAAEVYNREHKEAGKRNGPLGHIGIEVLRELYRLVDYKSGRLDPSIDYLTKKLRRSRDAVVRALAALRRHGFLQWIRRTEPVDNPGAGPQVRQISNAYWFDLPAKAKALVGMILGRGSPKPDDQAQREADDAAAVEAMLVQAGPEAAARFIAGDTALGNSLARLGRSLGSSASPSNGQNPA
jgi:hypothetical protein